MRFARSAGVRNHPSFLIAIREQGTPSALQPDEQGFSKQQRAGWLPRRAHDCFGARIRAASETSTSIRNIIRGPKTTPPA